MRRGGAGERGMRLRVAPRRQAARRLRHRCRRRRKSSYSHCPPPSRTSSELLPSRAAVSNQRRHSSRSMSFSWLNFWAQIFAASRQLRKGLAAAAAVAAAAAAVTAAAAAAEVVAMGNGSGMSWLSHNLLQCRGLGCRSRASHGNGCLGTGSEIRPVWTSTGPGCHWRCSPESK